MDSFSFFYKHNCRYVPPRWWHCVMNLEFTVAVTHSFGSAGNDEAMHVLYQEFAEYDEMSARGWWIEMNEKKKWERMTRTQ